MTPTNRWRIFMLVLGSAAFGVCRGLLGYPGQAALLTALGVVVLAYVARRTYHEQLRLYRASSAWSAELEASSGDDPGEGEDPPSAP